MSRRDREKPFAPARLKTAAEALAFAKLVQKKTGVRLVKDLRKHPKGAALARVRKFQQEHGTYLAKKNRMTFVRLNKKTKGKVKDKVHPSAVLPTGVFIQRPKMKGVRVRVLKSGQVRISNPHRLNVVVSLDQEALADSPKAAVRQAIREQGIEGRKPHQVILLVNGHQFKRAPMSVQAFYHYFDILYERVTNHPKKPMDAEDVAEVFSLELVYWKQGGKQVRARRMAASEFFEEEEEDFDEE